MSRLKACFNIASVFKTIALTFSLTLFSVSLPAQESYRSVTPLASVEIVPLNVSIQNDSVTLHWKVLLSDLRVRTNYSHVLIPILTEANNSLSLPRIIISGRRRASYDKRERALDPFQRKPYSVSIYHRRRPIEPIYYSVTFPYSSWMAHCSLSLHQVSESARRTVLLSNERICQRLFPHLEAPQQVASTPPAAATPAEVVKIEIVKPVVVQQQPVAVQQQPVAAKPEPVQPPIAAVCPVVPVTPVVPVAPVASVVPVAPQPDSIRIALFLSYPVGFSGINALFSDNATELAKIDRLLLPLLRNPHRRIRRIRVTGYTSPDGIYQDNEQLSRKRAQDFVRYLRSVYPLPVGIPVRTAWVAEDWVGLRDYLVQTDLPFRNRALSIIDHVGIFEGRERQLMELDGGNFYRNIKRTIFPKLRRIELVVEQEDSYDETINK